MKRLIAAVFVMLASLALFVSCRPSPSGGAVSSIVEVEAQPLISSRSTPTGAYRAAARGVNDFAFRLGSAMAHDIGYENFVISPYSIWMPLAALVNATDDRHRPALFEALGLAGIAPEDINRTASRMLFDLTTPRHREWAEDWEEDIVPVRVANALFIDYRQGPRRDFAQVFADYFRGDVISLDFESAGAADAVNAWVNENTQGRIPRIVESFHEDTLAAIANTIYFSGRWRQEFNPGATSQGTFYGPAGESAACFMNMTTWFVYYEDEHIQAVNMPFYEAGGMLIILPREQSAVDFFAAMTHEDFARIMYESRGRDGTLSLPRFAIEYEINGLHDVLAGLGVPLFDIELAPLTGGLVEDDGIPVWLDSALHRAMIEVDEEGVTAAAVTMMPVMGCAAPDPQPFMMICNRPFVFILHSHTMDGGNQVLFTGVVNRP